MIDVYVCSVSRFKDYDMLPKYAKAELKKLKVESAKEQKRAVYGLLAYALKSTFSLEFNPKQMSKNKQGKPLLKGYFVSFSHTNDLVSVAVSKNNVGIDIEELKKHSALDPLKTKILFDGENASSVEEALCLWTKKEAIFKLDDGIDKYIPSNIDTSAYKTKASKVEYNEKVFSLSVAADNISNVNFMMLDGKIIV
jgi:phosphopantetheinyl transferase